MASFKPKRQQSQNSEDRVYPSPKNDGLQVARVSLIVDMGTQEQEDAVYEYNASSEDHKAAIDSGRGKLTVPVYGELKGKQCIQIPRKPKDSVAVFVDLVEDTVDYGGEIGEKHYRLMLNKSYRAEIAPIPFGAVKPKVDGAMWTFAPSSMLSKLAIATNTPEVIGKGTDDENMDLGLLLGKALQINVEITETEKNGKTYKNVHNKGLSPCRKTDVVPELLTPAMIVTFDDATVEQVKFLRKDLREKIKQAINFKGSNMEKAFIEAGFGGAVQVADKAEEQQAPVPSIDELDTEGEDPF